MNDVGDTEKSKQSNKMDNVGKIHVKQPHKILKDCSLKSTNDDVQRAIEGLKEMPDEELQEFLDDEDFMEGLDVVDAWEGDEDKNREVERRMDSIEQREKRSSREHHRQRQRKGSCSREKSKKEDKKREETLRRDPAKSTKDIERDKIRTKRDTENKLLAEKEKAIKHLLDSDNVVPPGTESEAIQSITEKQNMERAQQRERRSRERRRSVDRFVKLSPSRRRTPDKLRSSPHRRKSPFVMSPERRRSPFNRTSTERHRSPKYSPGKRRHSPRYIFDRLSPSASNSDRRRSPRPSWDRRSSADRSAERHRRRGDVHERRRSRSRDRRSRSLEHSRRRSSRSPTNRRYSPRRRTPEQKRARKRSPFINEIARQLRDEAMKPADANSGYVTASSLMERITPLLNVPPVYQQETNTTVPSVTSSAYILQPSPSGPSPSVLPMPNGPPTFMNFDISAGPSLTFESPISLHPLPPAEYSAGPIMYNQPNTTPIQAPPPPVIRPPLLSTPVPPPQPVPAPMMDHNQMPYNPSHVLTVVQPSLIHQLESANKSSTAPSSASQSYKERKSTTPYNIFQERLKTPEPPVISKPKQFEKTSLSSLLEASVSAKDSLNIPVLYPGFKPEIMRHCEQALCQLPLEDPRLKMKGRFFYVREEEDTKNEPEDHTSNSILLQRGKTKICWDENTEQLVPIVKPTTQMHQKICQTDKLETETKGVQTNFENSVATRNCQTQIDSNDLEANIEKKQPIANRLDWNIRETYEYEPKYRNVEDLRWSLNNSSQRRFWNRQTSPSRKSDEHEQEEHEHQVKSVDHMARNVRLDSTFNSRNDYTSQQAREYNDHDRYSPNYRHLVEQGDYHDRRSDHSRGESPMELENSDDELETDNTFEKESNWYKRGKVLRGKTHIYRGKHTGGRPYRSRGGFRGKF